MTRAKNELILSVFGNEVSSGKWASQSNAILWDIGRSLINELGAKEDTLENRKQLHIIAIGTLVAALAYNRGKYGLGSGQYSYISTDPKNEFFEVPYYELNWDKLYAACNMEEFLAPFDQTEARFRFISKNNPLYLNIVLRTGTKIMEGTLPFEAKQLKAIFPKLGSLIDDIEQYRIDPKVFEQAQAEQITAEKTTTEKAMAGKTVAQKAAVEKTAAEEVATEKTATGKAAIEKEATEKTALTNLKATVKNAETAYTNHSKQILTLISIFHRHGGAGRARASSFSQDIHAENAITLSSGQSAIIAFLENPKNGNTHPHSFRTILLQKLLTQSEKEDVPEEKELVYISKNFNESLEKLKNSWNSATPDNSPLPTNPTFL